MMIIKWVSITSSIFNQLFKKCFYLFFIVWSRFFNITEDLLSMLEYLIFNRLADCLINKTRQLLFNFVSIIIYLEIVVYYFRLIILVIVSCCLSCLLFCFYFCFFLFTYTPFLLQFLLIKLCFFNFLFFNLFLLVFPFSFFIF